MTNKRCIREFFKWMLYPTSIKIMSGPLAGYKWIPSSGSNFIRGTYEPEKTSAICKMVKRGDTVLDIGAHVGYFSILMSKLVEDTGWIYSFEPRRINFTFLKRHIHINNCKNITVFEKAVGGYDGEALLETRTGTGTGKISNTGNIKVGITSIDSLYSRNPDLRRPTFMKIDVEGGEVEVLKGAAFTIHAHKPRIILATHNSELDEECNQWMKNEGYYSEEINQMVGDKETVYYHSLNP